MALWQGSRQSQIDEYMKQFKGFTVSRRQCGTDLKTGVLIDDLRKLVCLLTIQGESFSHQFVSFQDILSCELDVREKEHVETKKKGTLGRAVIGDTLFGAPGALAGALGGRSVSETKRITTFVALRLTVNNVNCPSFTLGFYEAGAFMTWFIPEFTGTEGEQAKAKAIEWKAILDGIVVQGVTIRNKVLAMNQSKFGVSESRISLADEIEKLAVLRERGLLTSDEFETEKRRLLSDRASR